MLDCDKYVFKGIEIFRCTDIIMTGDESNTVLFQSELEAKLEELKEQNYTVEIGNISTTTLCNLHEGDVLVLYTICLSLYTSKEQIVKDKEKNKYLSNIPEYTSVQQLYANTLSKSTNYFLADKKDIAKEYDILYNKIKEEIKYADKTYHYMSQEYRDYCAKIYESAKMDYDRLNRKYKYY